MVRRARVARKPKPFGGVNISPHLLGEVNRLLVIQRAAYLGTFDTKRSMSDILTEALKMYLAKFREDFALAGELPDPKLHPAAFDELVRQVVERRQQRGSTAH